jgi:hypothetical protein
VTDGSVGGIAQALPPNLAPSTARVGLHATSTRWYRSTDCRYRLQGRAGHRPLKPALWIVICNMLESLPVKTLKPRILPFEHSCRGLLKPVSKLLMSEGGCGACSGIGSLRVGRLVVCLLPVGPMPVTGSRAEELLPVTWQ